MKPALALLALLATGAPALAQDELIAEIAFGSETFRHEGGRYWIGMVHMPSSPTLEPVTRVSISRAGQDFRPVAADMREAAEVVTAWCTGKKLRIDDSNEAGDFDPGAGRDHPDWNFDNLCEIETDEALRRFGGGKPSPLPKGFLHDGVDYDVTLRARVVDGPVTGADGTTVNAHYSLGLVRLKAKGMTGRATERDAALDAARAWCGAYGHGLQPEGSPLLPEPQLWFEDGAWQIIALCKAPAP